MCVYKLSDQLIVVTQFVRVVILRIELRIGSRKVVIFFGTQIQGGQEVARNMAEAVVDGMPSKFFCHQCSREIDIPLLPDYKCPLCSSGFIEELMNDANSEDPNLERLDYDDSMDAEILPDELRSAFSRENWRRRARRAHNPDSRQIRNVRHRAIRRSRRQPRNADDRALQLPIENLIQDFIANLTGMNLPIQGQQGPLLNISLLLENHGDYVWGRDGLDAIVTQLLNQMDGTGPPPLPKKQIDEIPIIPVAQTHIDTKLQCSVCWEDFVLSESVKQLPCQHLYHVPCIVPWLELHGTCPICRQSLSEQSSSDAGNEAQSQDTVNLATIFSSQTQSSSSSNTPSTSSPTTSAPSGSSTRTNFSN